MGLRGTYSRKDWHRVRDLVIEVGRNHGFAHVTSRVDRPGNLSFVGHDLKYGAQYDFGMENNAVLGIETGCLRWGATPHATP